MARGPTLTVLAVGRAIAIAFAEAGASSIALLGRRADKLESTAAEINNRFPNSKAACKPTDLTEKTQIEKTFTELSEEDGKIDILVNNAGALPDPAAIAGVDEELLQSIFSVNVFGALTVAQVFLKYASPEPTLLNINSGISHMAPLRNMGVYAASKAANAKVFDYLALENPHVHLVNVQPGVVNTEMNREGKVQTQDEREWQISSFRG